MGFLSGAPYHEERPWGSFVEFVRNAPATVKIITVRAGEAFSLQQHAHRDETWYVLSGDGIVRIGDTESAAHPGDTYVAPRGTAHRITGGTSDLSILEVSLGEFDENDITRLEDRYGRV